MVLGVYGALFRWCSVSIMLGLYCARFIQNWLCTVLVVYGVRVLWCSFSMGLGFNGPFLVVSRL